VTSAIAGIIFYRIIKYKHILM